MISKDLFPKWSRYHSRARESTSLKVFANSELKQVTNEMFSIFCFRHVLSIYFLSIHFLDHHCKHKGSKGFWNNSFEKFLLYLEIIIHSDLEFTVNHLFYIWMFRPCYIFTYLAMCIKWTYYKVPPKGDEEIK
jgi:hypothetical protein